MLRRVLVGFLIVSACSTADRPGHRAGTPEERGALFEDLVRKVLAREAFSPVKNRRFHLDFERQAASLRDAFIAADTEAELFQAVLRLSNLRRDGHLEVLPVPDGLRLAFDRPRHAPLRFSVDFGDEARPALFVTAMDRRLERHVVAAEPAGVEPAFGDRLLAVNDVPVEQVLRNMEPYIAYATPGRLWTEFAQQVTTRRADFPDSMYREPARFTLEARDRGTYVLTLPYLEAERLEWNAWRPVKWSGFHTALETESFTLLLPERTDLRVIVLEWRGFLEDPLGDVDRLMAFATARGLLDHDVVCDLTTSRGGRGGWYLLQRLASRPFRVTLSNHRISDITPSLIREMTEAEPREGPFRVSDERLRAWFATEVTAAHARGDAYTRAVPFKLQPLPADSDGILEPASTHFTGRLVCCFGPGAHSQVDQVAAMVIDNGLGHSIGLPTAGQSNSWEWSETIHFPRSGRPVARFRWSVGQTIRPNGEVLEGNPPEPAERVPPTRDSYPSYYDDLLARALNHLARVDR